MKKIVSISLACVLLLGCIFAFSSCSMLSGTYVSEYDEDFSVVFIANYMITMQEDYGNYYMQVYNYSIDDDEIELTRVCVLSTDVEDAEDVAEINEEIKENSKEDNTQTLPFAKEDDTILIGLVPFVKE